MSIDLRTLTIRNDEVVGGKQVLLRFFWSRTAGPLNIIHLYFSIILDSPELVKTALLGMLFLNLLATEF